MSKTTTVGVCTVRITREDESGTPVAGDPQGAILICDGIMEVTFDSEIEEGQEIGPKLDSCGNLCLSGKRPDPGVKWDNFSIKFCGLSNALKELLGQENAILDGTAIIGTGVPAGGGCGTTQAAKYVGIEMWAENWDCDGPDATVPWKRIIFPKAAGRFTGSTIDGSGSEWTWEGRGYANPNFGTGAFGDLTVPVDPSHVREIRDQVDADRPICVDSYEYVATP